MFSASNFTPKSYKTGAGGANGALALLMKSLQGLGDNAQGISNSAGTSIAEDRLKAMSPEERQGTGVMDKMSGLALTDQFRKRMEQGEKDAVNRNVVADKEAFITKRDSTLNQYDIAGDNRQNAMNIAKAKLLGKGTAQENMTPEKTLEYEKGIAELDKIIADNQISNSTNAEAGGLTSPEREQIIAQAQKRKYEMLQEMGQKEIVARKSFDMSPSVKRLTKYISGKDQSEKK